MSFAAGALMHFGFRQRLGWLLTSMLAWLAAGAIYSLIRFYGTRDFMDWTLSTPTVVLLWFVGSCFFGLMFWLADLLCDRPALRVQSYGFLILFRSLLLVASTIGMVMLTRLAAWWLGQITAAEIVPTFAVRMIAPPTIIFMAYVFLVAGLFNFVRQMSLMLGPRVLRNLLLGKYRQPVEEQRIFMFLDMRDSTGHAERLGHNRFSRLLQDCFNDLTDSGLRHQVEVYQYVGDEAVLTWNWADGLQGANCVRTFFDFKATLLARSAYYLKRYGLVPEFKAGINLGPVTVAEVGVLKREIAYHGETLITAARLQGMCNEHQLDILVAEELANRLDREPGLRFAGVGSLSVKGRQTTVQAFSVAELA